MKVSIKFITAIVLLFAFSININAQRGDRRERSPEMRAERQNARLVEELGLDETKAAQLKDINLVFTEKIATVRKAEEEKQRAAMKAKLEPLRAEQEAAIKQLLTPEQAAKFDELKAMREERRGERGGRRGPRGEGKGKRKL